MSDLVGASSAWVHWRMLAWRTPLFPGGLPLSLEPTLDPADCYDETPTFKAESSPLLIRG